ncbi:hypothetical protein GGD54_004508 [Rhizobium tropici]|uniref:DUF1127 domain-containing protein n=1 Tax=Rhizobium tropici TaxID=398 RepID=A0ABR6R4J7_RHITR|nr:hypothetical protein [Rhizobium tropici]MBB5593277.1 hypothetical protein [Rhizobium tropici]MBB6494088.1 hypothetical protein [Rhizobium tropici]TGE95984.1 hypothetical protein C9417_17910 [Rhizobium sp. SEMIA 4088]
MNILHVESWRTWFVRLLIRQGASERRSHNEGGRKRDMLLEENQHLLRDVGLINLAEKQSKDGRC